MTGHPGVKAFRRLEPAPIGNAGPAEGVRSRGATIRSAAPEPKRKAQGFTLAFRRFPAAAPLTSHLYAM